MPRDPESGLVISVSVRHHPDARPLDIALHIRAANVARRYGGLQGRIRQLIAWFRKKFTGREPPPVELQLEVWKLERAVQWRLHQISANTPTARELDLLDSEVDVLRAQLAVYRARLSDPSSWAASRTGTVAMKTTPPGFPVAPAGHAYMVTNTGNWTLRPISSEVHLKLEVVDGLPTGRIINERAIDELGVEGREISDRTTRELLDRLGYDLNGTSITRRPGADHEKLPLVVEDGKVKVDRTLATKELNTHLTMTQQQRLENALLVGTPPDGLIPAQAEYLRANLDPNKLRQLSLLGRRELMALRSLAQGKNPAALSGMLQNNPEMLKMLAGVGSRFNNLPNSIAARRLKLAREELLAIDSSGTNILERTFKVEERLRSGTKPEKNNLRGDILEMLATLRAQRTYSHTTHRVLSGSKVMEHQVRPDGTEFASLADFEAYWLAQGKPKKAKGAIADDGKI